MADIFDLADVWNDADVTFTAIKMNVTDTASAAASNLLDLQVGGDSRFSVDKAGLASAESLFSKNLYQGTSFGGIRFSSTAIGIAVRNANFIGFGSSAVLGIGSPSVDVTMFRDGPGILALRNSTNAQAFNIYNTFTDASNYERARMGWDGNAFEIKPQAEGTGTVRTIHISGLPTTNPGPGILWNDAGTPAIGT